MNNKPFTTAILVVLFSTAYYQTAHAMLYQTTGHFNLDISRSGKINNLTQTDYSTVKIAGFDQSLGILNSVNIVIGGGGSGWDTGANSFQQDMNYGGGYNHDAWNTFKINKYLSTDNQVLISEEFELATVVDPGTYSSSSVTSRTVDAHPHFLGYVTETDIDASDYFLRFNDSDITYTGQFKGDMSSGGSTLDSAFFYADWSMNITHIYNFTPIPEPVGLLLFSTGLVILLGVKRKL